MGRTKSHNWWFAVIHKPKEKTAIVTLSLCYKYTTPKRFGTAIRIPYECWDINAKAIRILSKYKHLNLEAYSELLLTYKQKISYVKREMAEGRMTYQTGAEYILHKVKDELLSDYLTTDYFSVDGVQKHSLRLRSVQKYLAEQGHQALVPLSYSILSDDRNVKLIAKCISENPNIKVNTAYDYLQSINAICNKRKGFGRPFTRLDLMPSKSDYYGSNPVLPIQLYDGINNIKTKQQFEAVVYWLYMFCLTAIDAVDVANTSEESFDAKDLKYIKDKGLLHYHPKHILQGELSAYSRKLYRKGRRAKGGNNIGGTMFNMFPTLVLHKVLKMLIKETHPHLAYSGTDKIRLFNFLTKDRSNRTLADGKAKWTMYRNAMSKNLKKLGIGNGFKQVRDTFTTQGEELQISKGLLQEYLGHSKGKETITHYRSPSQVTKDVYHMQIVQEFGIIQLTNIILTKGEHCGYLPTGKSLKKVGHKTYGGTLEPHPYLTDEECSMLVTEKLSQWSVDKELKLERLRKQFYENPTPSFVDGKVIYSTKESDMPDELKELLQEKSDLFVLDEIAKEGYSIQKP